MSAIRSPRRLLPALLLFATVGLAACGTEPRSVVAPPTDPPTDSSLEIADTAVETTRVARPTTETAVFPAPGATAASQVLPARSEFGSALALVVVDDRTPGWLQVQLPTRPNESTGWIRADGIEIREVTLAVRVDLAARRLVVTDGDEVVLDAPVAIGAPATPTPTGTFFVVDKLAAANGAGSYGPFALGLSAHSEVLTEFAGGDGQVGIHGTNQPSSIGGDVSNGCVRVANDVTEALNALLPLGTPVTIS